jgi:hypothetical protein
MSENYDILTVEEIEYPILNLDMLGSEFINTIPKKICGGSS